MCNVCGLRSRRYVWNFLCSYIFLVIYCTDQILALQKGRLMVPSSYTALSGDLHVQLQLLEPLLSPVNDLGLQITRLSNNFKDIINTISIYPDPRSNITQIALRCNNFLLGGIYELEIVNKINSSSKENHDERLKHQLDVRWPTPKLSITPESIGTYPEEPVDVVLTFPEVDCDMQAVNNPIESEFWIELLYCGQEIVCTATNNSKSQILYAEQIRGYPKTRLIKLRCELFGLAGHYVIQLRPSLPTPSFVSAVAYLHTDWNEKFIFNVHARSIFPCDPHTGIGVLFEYPACILDQSDRIRLFAKLRADVASLQPPTTLHYVTEQRVIRGQHSLHFDCELFSEKFVEYCFVYVSQAISGAVADIRMDCVPTLPVSDSDTGGWGPWSEWTPCSSTCTGGTRNRYRFCDSPPPRYGAKFCEGPTVETEHCGDSKIDTWECLYGPGIFSANKLPLERSDVVAEIGPGCRCGCIVHLGSSKPKRLLASSARSCPGRSFWLIQADDSNRLKLSLDYFGLLCPTQYIKARDGDSLSSNLLAEYIGGTRFKPEIVTSSGSQLLLEFFSDELASFEGTCSGGFLAHVQQSAFERRNISLLKRKVLAQRPRMHNNLTIVHITALIFASIIIVISALLGTQYILRYRKYHLTESKGEIDSPAHTPRAASLGSMMNNTDSPPSRAISTTTLLSEVIYLVKTRPKRRMKHSILRESIDGEALVNETELNEKCTEFRGGDNLSTSSSHTLTNGTTNDGSSNTNDKEKCSLSYADNDSISSRPSLSISNKESIGEISTIKEQNDFSSEKSKNNVGYKGNITKCEISPLRKIRVLSASTATLTNGSYSPAASIISTATIRTTNPKESKEKQNREKLLARPDSEFSLANPEDFELDYYDYNVVNAGAAPGSYLGMDPAYLVWIPPFDDATIDFDDNQGPQYEEILPNFNNIDPGSNKETPEYDNPENLQLHQNNKILQENDNIKNSLIQKSIVTALLSDDIQNYEKRKNSTAIKLSSKILNTDIISLNDFGTKCLTSRSSSQLIKTHSRKNSDVEKETSVMKSPSDNLQEYYELDDIQFADEDENIEQENNKTKTIKYNSNYKIKI